MNLINRPLPDFKFIKWRKDNVAFLLEEYVPFLLSKLESKYSKVKDTNLKEPTSDTELEGYQIGNVKLLDITLETLRGEFDLTLRLPVPNQQDTFFINRNTYILVNQLEEHIFYFFNKDIKTQKFVIYFNEGTWRAHQGSTPKKNVKARPVLTVLWALDLLDKYFPGWEVTTEPNEHTKHIFPLKGKKFFQFDKSVNLHNPLTQLVINSITFNKGKLSFSNTEKTETLTALEKNSPITFYYEFMTKCNDIRCLYENIFDMYQNPTYHPFSEIHGAFSKVSYYHQVIRMLELKVANIKRIFERARNLTSDISWHQKIPDTFLKNFITHKGLQYLEPNIFKEIDFKYKQTYFLQNVPVYLREPRFSLIKHIDFVASPDNKKIGIVQQLIYDCEVNEHGYFVL